MGKKAVKFGGTSLCNAAQMKKAAEIVRADTERQLVIVSAPGKRMPQDEKITDMLFRMQKAGNLNERKEIFKAVQNRFDMMIHELLLPLDFSEEYCYIAEEANGDFLISRGEYFCAKIFAALLDFTFIDAKDVIFFKENGMIDTEKTRKMFAERLSENEKAVIPGFYGSMPNGDIRLFPRGGSDITGAVVADAIHADIYENFTDVSGFLLTDPKIVNNPKTVPTLSYGELRRLSSMGAFVLHADTILPLYEKKIPIVIRNTNDPNGACTWIMSQKTENAVGGIVGQKGYTLFSVSRTGIGEDIADFKELLSLFERYTSSVYSTPRTVDACGILVKSEDIQNEKEKILHEIHTYFHAESVVLTERMALLSVISEGSASQNTKIILQTMEEIGAVPLLLDGGADMLGVTVGFDESYLEKLIVRLYEIFEKDL
ncbi:MAG: aspartate kinase [Clostridia bacterium]|nr:aspartate kinase [Clostridia bacterium]